MADVAAVVDELHSCLDLLNGCVADDLDSGEFGGLVEQLGKAQCKLDAATLVLTRRFDRSGMWHKDGARNAKAWLRTRLGVPDSHAGNQIADAKALSKMPVVAAALAEGTVSRSRVGLLAKASSGERAGLFARDEELLVEQTVGFSYRLFSKAVRYWIDIANDELGLGEPDPHETRTACSRGDGDDQWLIKAVLDVVAGVEVDAELRRLQDELFAEDWAEAVARLGDGNVTTDDLARSPGQRLADALVEMARRSAATTKPGAPARRVINLRMDYQTFLAERAQLAKDQQAKQQQADPEQPDPEQPDPLAGPEQPDQAPASEPLADPEQPEQLEPLAGPEQPEPLPDSEGPANPVWGGRVSETEAGHVVAPSLILTPEDGVHVRRVVFGSKGHILDFGYATRLFTGGLRQAIIERDQQCSHPYCETPGSYCQVDHVIEYEDGGHTKEQNGRLLCGYHNRLKHTQKHARKRAP